MQPLKTNLLKNSNGCLEWQGSKDNGGYGLIKLGDKTWKVHRLVWTMHHGQIISGMCICHKCDNPSCANIEHLFIGTHSDNAMDRQYKYRGWEDRATHCPKGHEYTENSVYITRKKKSGTIGRTCKLCCLERNRAKRNALKNEISKET